MKFYPALKDETTESHELAKRSSELGALIWQAIHSDAQITKELFERLWRYLRFQPLVARRAVPARVWAPRRGSRFTLSRRKSRGRPPVI